MPLGFNNVDKEIRLDFGKFRREKMEKLQAAIKKTDMGALLLFDWDNIRYATSTS